MVIMTKFLIFLKPSLQILRIGNCFRGSNECPLHGPTLHKNLQKDREGVNMVSLLLWFMRGNFVTLRSVS
jgi:hypothetical protein